MSDPDPRLQPHEPGTERAVPGGSAPVDAAAEGVAVPPGTGGAGTGRHDDFGWASLIGDPDRFASEWARIETGFVEDPKRAVQEADHLVGEVAQALSDSITGIRAQLAHQWGDAEVGTEDLRLTLQRYRSFLHLLIAR